MKNKVTGVSVNIIDYRLSGDKQVGVIYFHRQNQDENRSVSSSANIYPRNVARALEAQRLFLAQLEKKATGT